MYQFFLFRFISLYRTHLIAHHLSETNCCVFFNEMLKIATEYCEYCTIPSQHRSMHHSMQFWSIHINKTQWPRNFPMHGEEQLCLGSQMVTVLWSQAQLGSGMRSGIPSTAHAMVTIPLHACPYLCKYTRPFFQSDGWDDNWGLTRIWGGYILHTQILIH